LTVENCDGELRQLLEVKRAYRTDLAAFETDLKARYERELADAKKRFKEQYLERIVDVVFAEAAPVQEPSPQLALPPEPAVEVKKSGICPECDAPVGPDDKFCSKCAAPLKEEDERESQAVVSAGRKFSTRHRA